MYTSRFGPLFENASDMNKAKQVAKSQQRTADGNHDGDVLEDHETNICPVREDDDRGLARVRVVVEPEEAVLRAEEHDQLFLPDVAAEELIRIHVRDQLKVVALRVRRGLRRGGDRLCGLIKKS